MRIFRFLKNIISNEKKFLVFVFVLALILRVGFLLTLENRYYFSDSLEYEDCAKSILAGNGFGDFSRAPLYSVWLAGIFSIAGEGNILAVRITEAVLGSSLCLVLFFLGRMLYSRKVGVTAAIGMAFYPIFVFLPSLNYPTLICTLLISLGTLAVVSLSKRDQIWLALTAGVCFSSAALAVAPTATLLAPVLFWVLMFSESSSKKKWTHVCLIVIAFAVTMTPWTIRNFLYHGKFIPIRPGVAQHMSFYEDGKVNYEKRKKTDLDEKIKSVQDNSTVFLKDYSRKFLRFWRLAPSRDLKSADPNYNIKIYSKDKRITKTNKFSRADLTFIVSGLTFGPILFFSILGLFLLNRSIRNSLILIVLPLTLAFTYSFFYTNVRYRLPVEPLLIVFASNSFIMVVEWIKNRLKAKTPLFESGSFSEQKSEIADSETN